MTTSVGTYKGLPLPTLVVGGRAEALPSPPVFDLWHDCWQMPSVVACGVTRGNVLGTPDCWQRLAELAIARHPLERP